RRAHLENGAEIVRAALARGAVEAAVCSKEQGRLGESPVAPGEAVQSCDVPGGVDLENCAGAVRPAQTRRSIEGTVRTLNEARVGSACAMKAVNDIVGLGLCDGGVEDDEGEQED